MKMSGLRKQSNEGIKIKMVPLILLKKWHTRGRLCAIFYRIAHDDVGLDGNPVRA